MRYKSDYFASKLALLPKHVALPKWKLMSTWKGCRSCGMCAQVFVPTVKPQADDGDFYRSFAPYRALELFVCLFAGW